MFLYPDRILTRIDSKHFKQFWLKKFYIPYGIWLEGRSCLPQFPRSIGRGSDGNPIEKCHSGVAIYQVRNLLCDAMWARFMKYVQTVNPGIISSNV